MADTPSKKPSIPSLRAVRQTSEPPAAATIEEIARDCRQTRRLLELHIQTAREDRERAEQRHQAVIGLLGDVIARLP